jgi:phosphomannomutase
MEQAEGAVVGYEANGGFLLGFEAKGPRGALAPLMTRDAILPILCTLWAAGGGTISARVGQEPRVATVSGLLRNIPHDRSTALLSEWVADAHARGAFLAALGAREDRLDLTDGVRMILTDGRVVHVRPSGNAPELRVYVECNERAEAQDLLDQAIEWLERALA